MNTSERNCIHWRRTSNFSLHLYSSSHPIPQCCTFGNQFRPRNQFRPIPGIPSNSGITISCMTTHLSLLVIWPNFGTEFREWNQDRIGRNSWEFLGIPPNSGITISYMTTYLSFLVIRLNSGTEFRELSQDGIGRNWTEFLGIPSNSWGWEWRVRVMILTLSPSHPHPLTLTPSPSHPHTLTLGMLCVHIEHNSYCQ
jgi:hypothetical protein